MHNLASLDLRLLTLFEALDGQRSVSRAADVLDLPQPAVSQGLKRLRTLFGDVLFVRTAGGMAPTPRALALRAPIAEMLAVARAHILPEPQFVPALSRREFRIVVTDFGAVSLLPGLMPVLEQTAPGVRIHLMPMERDVFERLVSTDADLAVGILGAAPPEIHTQNVFHDHYVCAVRAGHPALENGALSPEAFRSARHAVVTGTSDATVAAALRATDVALTVPSYASLPSVLARTDLIAIVPRTASRIFFGGAPVAFVELPFAAEPIAVVAAWHERNDADPGLRWLRDLVAVAIAGSEAALPDPDKVYT